MSSAFSTTAATAYLKTKYGSKVIPNMLSALALPAWKAVKKDTTGGGDGVKFTQDVSSYFSFGPFSEAQTAAGSAPTQGLQFNFDYSTIHNVVDVDVDAVERSRNNSLAWAKIIDLAVKKTVAGAAHGYAVCFIGQGWGEISPYGITGSSGSTFKMAEASHIYRILPGMRLVGAQTLDSGTLRSATALTVSAVDYDANLVTMSAALSTVSWVDGDIVFISGMRDNNSSPTRLAPVGMGAWIPAKPSSAVTTANKTLGGKDRSGDSRYFGQYLDISDGSETALEGLIDLVQKAATVGGATKLQLYGSQATYTNIAKQLQDSGVRYVDNPGEKSVGLKGLTIYSEGDLTAKLQVDRTFGDDFVMGWDPGQIEVVSPGELPHWSEDDGRMWARRDGAAAYEARMIGLSVICPMNPAACVRLQLKTPATK